MKGALGLEAYFSKAIQALLDGKLRFDLRILDDFAEARESREAEPVFDPARPIEVPGLVLAGEPSVPAVRTRPVDVERLRATSPRIRHETVPGAGHFIHCERNTRDAYIRALTAFFSGFDD